MRTIIFLLFFATQNLSAQVSESSILGMWEVTEVNVGDRSMTPIAKWVEFYADHRQRGGNGWMQHTVGDWEMDAEKALLSLHTDNGFKDEYGAFKVSLADGKMFWEREEEGMKVNVVLKRASVMPQAHWDKVLGLWLLEKVEGDEKDDGFFTPGKLALYFGWDRRFFFNQGSFRAPGRWHANAHRPLIELKPNSEDVSETYQVEFVEGKLKMTIEKDDKKATFTWKRIDELPE